MMALIYVFLCVSPVQPRIKWTPVSKSYWAGADTSQTFCKASTIESYLYAGLTVNMNAVGVLICSTTHLEDRWVSLLEGTT